MQQQVSIGYGPSIIMMPKDLEVFLGVLTRATMLDDKKELVPVHFRVEPAKLPNEKGDEVERIKPAPAIPTPPIVDPDDEILF